MKKKRHSVAEISAKLKQAGEMAAAGKTQSEIARALGISVMTYHRWRNLPAAPPVAETSAAEESARITEPPPQDRAGRMAELQLENSRLRRLVANLMLEKLALEDALGERTPGRRRTNG